MRDRCDINFVFKLSILVSVGILVMLRSNIEGRDFLTVNKSVRTNIINQTERSVH